MSVLSGVTGALARYMGRKGYGGFAYRDAAQLDYAASNNYQEVGRDAADTYDIEIWRVDSANRIRLGNAVYNPARRPMPFNIALNSKIASNLAQTFYIAGGDSSLTDTLEIHATAGNDAAAVTITITKETGVAAPGTGTAVWSATLSLKATANTFQLATLADVYKRKYPGSDGNAISLKSGDRLSVKITGTTTTLAGLCLTAYTQPGLSAPYAGYTVHANGDIATQYIYIANEHRTISSVQVYYGTKSSGANTVDVTKDTGTTAPGAGTTILAAAQALDSTAGTVYTPALSATASVLDMAPGDRLAVKFATVTALADIVIIVHFTPLYNSTVDVMLAIGPNGIQGTDQCFFIADRPYEIVDMSEAHGTAAGAALKGLVTIDRTTSAPGAGVATQTDNASAGFDLNGTANTVQVATAGTRRNRLLKRGERLGFKHSDVPGTLAKMIVGVTLLPR